MKHPESLSEIEKKTIIIRISFFPSYKKFLNQVKSRLANDGMTIEDKQMNADLLCGNMKRWTNPNKTRNSPKKD